MHLSEQKRESAAKTNAELQWLENGVEILGSTAALGLALLFKGLFSMFSTTDSD